MKQAVLLASHGTVDDLRDLPGFLANVRRGRPASPELVAEVRRRVEAVGGSPLNRINAEVARKLGERLGLRVAWANRLWKPYVRDAIAELAKSGVRRIVLLPLAQHSAHVYCADARPAAHSAGVELACAPNWGQRSSLTQAFAARILTALKAVGGTANGAAKASNGEMGSRSHGTPTTVVMTAHSLPKAVVDAGDPYEREVRESALAVSAAAATAGADVHYVLAFQSQGLSSGGAPVEWLGPDLPTVLDEAVARGDRRVVAAPIGFLADHTETLYDLDIEGRALAEKRGLFYVRAASLNADDDFIEVLAEVARPLLGP
jgi:ferrochelatase